MPISKTVIVNSSGAATGWINVTSNTTLPINSKILVNTNNPITLTFPTALGEIELYNQNNSSVLVDLDGSKFNSANITDGQIVFSNRRARFLYVDGNIGWISLDGASRIIQRGYGNPLLRLQGSLNDSSGNNRNATVFTGTSPTITTGLNNLPVLRFNGTNQEIRVPLFLGNQSGATVYVVFTPNSTQYTLLRTNNLDDYWRFSQNAAGYLGVFRNARFEAYPTNMPASGSHLISIHSTANHYEVVQNNASKGVQTANTFFQGDRFAISPSARPYQGDISLILAYPYHAAGSPEYTEIITRIKGDYPSLPFTIV